MNPFSDTIRQRFGVASIAENLRWYVLRANDDTVRKIGPNLKVPGKWPKEPRDARSNVGKTRCIWT